MQLKPSEIFYSQDSISNTFDQKCTHSGVLIGQTLDDICEGRCSIDDIPTITVVQRDGKWITRDNRRLWVFRHLERLGKCEEISVKITHYIPEAKLTSENGGKDINVRRNPGGKWRYKQSKRRGTSNSRTQDRKIYDSNTQIMSKPLSNISNQYRQGTPNRQDSQLYDYSTEMPVKLFSSIPNQQRNGTNNSQYRQIYDHNTTIPFSQFSNSSHQQGLVTPYRTEGQTYDYSTAVFSKPLSNTSNQPSQDARLETRETATDYNERFTQSYRNSTPRSSYTSNARVAVPRSGLDDFDSLQSQPKRAQTTQAVNSERTNYQNREDHISERNHIPLIDQRRLSYEEDKGCCVIL